MMFDKIFILILHIVGLISGVITIILGIKNFSKTKNVKLINLLESIGKANKYQILLNNYRKYLKTQNIVIDLKTCEISIYRYNKTPWLILLGVFTLLFAISSIGVVSRPLFKPTTLVIVLFILALLTHFALIFLVVLNISDRTIINFLEKTIQSKYIFGVEKKEKLKESSKLISSFGSIYLKTKTNEYLLHVNHDIEEYEVWNYLIEQVK